jgi:hypothetical protein
VFFPSPVGRGQGEGFSSGDAPIFNKVATYVKYIVRFPCIDVKYQILILFIGKNYGYFSPVGADRDPPLLHPPLQNQQRDPTWKFTN